MSEFHIISTDANIPSDVPTSFQTDDGTGVPAAHILIMHGYDSTENNVFGITSKGDGAAGNPPGTGLANEVDYYLTNRDHSNATTVGVTTANVITFSPPSTRGIYDLTFYVAGWCDTDTLGASYQVTGSVRSNGVNLATTGTPVRTMVGDTTLFSVELVDVVIAAGPSIVLQATGLSPLGVDKTIKWTAVMTYTFGGA